MSDDRFLAIEAFCERIEREVYHNTPYLLQLSEYGFRTRPEGDLARAQKRAQSLADYLQKQLDEIAARRQRAA